MTGDLQYLLCGVPLCLLMLQGCSISVSLLDLGLKMQAEPGSRLQLGRVLALKDEGVFTVGKPYLESVVVEAEVLEDAKGPKLTIFKYRAKKHYRKKTGHRQPLTKFLVTKIDKQ